MPAALTKKAKKALAFKQKKSGKPARSGEDGDGLRDIPEIETLDDDDVAAPVADPPPHAEAPAQTAKQPKAGKATGAAPAASGSTAKRKRATADEGGDDGAQAAKPRAKKAKLAEGEAEDAKNKPRYILFLGSSLRAQSRANGRSSGPQAI